MKKYIVILIVLFGSQSIFSQEDHRELVNNSAVKKEIENKESNNPEVVNTIHVGANQHRKNITIYKAKTWNDYQKEYRKGIRSSKFLEEYIIARKREIKGPIPTELKFQLLNAYYLEKKKKLKGKL